MELAVKSKTTCKLAIRRINKIGNLRGFNQRHLRKEQLNSGPRSRFKSMLKMAASLGICRGESKKEMVFGRQTQTHKFTMNVTGGC